MRWVPGSGRNVEDRRAGGGMMPMGIGGTVVLLILSLVFGRDFIGGSDGSSQQSQTAGGEVQQTPEEAKEVEFVKFVLDSTQATWSRLLPQSLGADWHDAKLVLYRQATQTGCGVGQAGMGPFYCPNDEKVYIDLSFYDQLAQRFGAPGDFAQAYVLAHELGHHVQHLLGTDAQVRRVQEGDPSQANHASVLLELQADCYAGVWGYYAKQGGVLEAGDLEEGLGAASAVGDDRIQASTRGSVNPDTFTHGSARQRTDWFIRGFQSGDPKQCDTFGRGA
jgi:predicted metalloprotease